MYRLKLLALVLVSALLPALFAPPARADELNKKTVMTITQPIQVPGAVLQPGTYVIKLVDSPTDRHIVRIMNADETQVIATVLAINNYRLKPTDNSKFSFYEEPAGQPQALRAWFYPGDQFGQEFVYPKQAAMQIASAANTNIPDTSVDTTTDLNTAPVTTVNNSGAETPLDQGTYTAPAVVDNTPAAAPAAEPAPVRMPKTASDAPLFGLLGVLALLALGGLRLFVPRPTL